MMASFSRILTIGRNTMLDSIRQRVLYVILLFGLASVASSLFFTGVVYHQEVKNVKDFSMAFMWIIGFVIALLSTAQLIPQELHNRTIYTILSKPVRRVEFLFGKFLGAVMLLATSLCLMSLVFAVVLGLQEQISLTNLNELYQVTADWKPNPDVMEAYAKDKGELYHQCHDPQMIGAVLLLFAQLVMVQGLALLFSTFATSFIYTVVTTCLVYIAGHMESIALDLWRKEHVHLSWLQSWVLDLTVILIPDFSKYSITDEILAGNFVPWVHITYLLGYSVNYLFVILLLSAISFRFREI